MDWFSYGNKLQVTFIVAFELVKVKMKCFGIKLFVLILCFKKAESGFFFGSSLLNWESARDDCQTRGKRLACLRNVTMYNAAKSYLQNTIGR
uniref:C-type lectin domain-containing protein n=1 Tax=Magallana gigas TaxID=29159 RepID=A0A8W8KMF7_MAGGI